MIERLLFVIKSDQRNITAADTFTRKRDNEALLFDGLLRLSLTRRAIVFCAPITRFFTFCRCILNVCDWDRLRGRVYRQNDGGLSALDLLPNQQVTWAANKKKLFSESLEDVVGSAARPNGRPVCVQWGTNR